MKALILKISLAVALSFGVTVGFAQQDAVKAKSNEQETKVESVVVKKKAMTEAEVKANGEVIGRVVLDPVWFLYDGDGSFNDPSNYTRSPLGDGDIVDECPNGPDELCAIKVEPDSGLPTALPNTTALTAMQSQITGTLDETNPSSNVILKLGESN